MLSMTSAARGRVADVYLKGQARVVASQMTCASSLANAREPRHDVLEACLVSILIDG